MPLGQEEAAAAIAARGQDVETIMGKLKTLMTLPDDDNFLIVAAGVYYVQFIAVRGTPGLSFEAVSNTNLEREDYIDTSSAAKLLALDFEAPEGDVTNFSMDFTPKDDNDYAYLAALAVAVFTDVFKVRGDREFEYETSSP